MKISLFTKSLEELKTEALVIGFYQDGLGEIEQINTISNNLVEEAIKEKEFTGKLNQTLLLRTNSPIKKIVLLGLGKREEFTKNKAREAIAKAATYSRDSGIKELSIQLCHDLHPQEAAQILVEGVKLGLYHFKVYKTQNLEDIKEIQTLTIVADKNNFLEVDKGIRTGLIITDAVYLARDLGNHPSNIVTPTYITQKAIEVSKKNGIKCTILENKDMKKLGMGGILAVNKGSVHPAKFIIMEYNGGKKGTICLVGKGITFDSGGISIKPSAAMEEMKFDMCGGAAVIAILQAASRLKLSYKIIGLVPTTENLPSGDAYKPGDIIKMYNGKTVDVINTDAEGRMILADALSYSKKYNPDVVIDYATLTGACVVALGDKCSGLFTQDEELAKQLLESGEKTGEKIWRLPLWDEYKEEIKSAYADMKNSGGREGGAITAAVFLKEFIHTKKWAHLDIAGTAWVTKGGNSTKPIGATGEGVRLTLEFLNVWKK